MIPGIVYLNPVARKNATIITFAWPFLQHSAGQHEYKNCKHKKTVTLNLSEHERKPDQQN